MVDISKHLMKRRTFHEVDYFFSTISGNERCDLVSLDGDHLVAA